MVELSSKSCRERVKAVQSQIYLCKKTPSWLQSPFIRVKTSLLCSAEANSSSALETLYLGADQTISLQPCSLKPCVGSLCGRETGRGGVRASCCLPSGFVFSQLLKKPSLTQIVSNSSAGHTYLTTWANPVDCSLVICCKKIIGLEQKPGLWATPPDSNIYWEVLPISNRTPLMPPSRAHSWR